MTTASLRLLDGGMGRELQRIGAPFRQPEWSALALIEAPEFVLQAHRAFIEAGARVITSNSYALVPFHIGEQRFNQQGRALAERAGQVARQAAADSGETVIVAGSLPPALGSYRPDLFDHSRSVAIHRVLIDGLSAHVDLWLAETQSSIAEVRAVAEALGGDGKPLWLSFTLLDVPGADGVARLRSGEAVADAVQVAAQLGARAVLFNCSQPEVMAQALRDGRQVLDALSLDLELGVYANAFPVVSSDAKANSTLLQIRDDLGPESYLHWARTWVEAGASIVGGCCGIGPEHIAALHRHWFAAEVQQATFGAGCFWGAEAAFRQLPGVLDSRVGFARPASGEALSIEVVQVDFDPTQIAYSRLIEAFWTLHDPTSVDRQGADVGVKYRSALFVNGPEQAATAEAAREQLDASGRLAKPVATVVLPLGEFERAAEEHQRYLEKHGASACSL
ncbi:putative homocysteine S-methyltransferase [Pseudomonas sp. CF161]|nr:putative homocysteine S-methyltransferase [Pseudomonas sp. CF161]